MTDERTCRYCGLADASVKTLDYGQTFEHRSPSACISALRAALAAATAREGELENERVAAFRALLPECSAHPGVPNTCHPEMCDCMPDTRLPAVIEVARAEERAEREAAVWAMREDAADLAEWLACNAYYSDSHGARMACLDVAAHIRATPLPTPTSALDAERERVVRWCWQEWAGGMRYDFDAESEIARALAAAKGGQG